MNLFRMTRRDGGPLVTPSAIGHGITSSSAGVWAWVVLPTRSTDDLGTAQLQRETMRGAAELKQMLPDGVPFHIKVQWSRYDGQQHYERERARWGQSVPPGLERYLQTHAAVLDRLHLPRRQVMLGVRLDEDAARTSPGQRLLGSGDSVRNADQAAQEYMARAQKWHARMAATSFGARAASVREIAWSLRRDMRRTVDWLPSGPLAGSGELTRLRAGEVHVYSDHLRIQTDTGVRFLRCLTNTVTGFPTTGLALPGGEWLRDLVGGADDPDDVRYPIEISVRGVNLSAREAHKRIKSALSLVKEQGREAAQGVAEEPPEAILEAREALMLRQAEISDGSVSEVEDNPVWLLEADTLEDLNAHSDEVIDSYGARRIDLWTAENLQGELWRSTVLGDRLRVGDFAQTRPMHTLVGSWFHGGSAVGQDSGPFLGSVVGSTPSPFLERFTDAALAGDPVTTAMLGRSGSGKSTALMLACLAEARYGSWVFQLDMKGDLGGITTASRMFDIPTTSIQADEVSSGAMCPFRYMPVRAGAGMNAVQAAIDLLMLMLRPAVADAAEPHIRSAANRVADYPDPQHRSTHAIIQLMANSDDPTTRQYGQELMELARDEIVVPVAGPPAPHLQPLPTTPGLVYFRFPSDVLPQRDSSREEWTPGNRLSMMLLRATFAYSTFMAGRVRGIPKVVALPELHRITAYGVGRSMVKETALMGRALDTSMILDTQAVAELESIDGMADQISCVLAFKVEAKAEAEAQARLLGREPDKEFIENQQGLRKGECIVRDRSGQMAPVYFDLLAAELAEALDTTPKRRAPEAADYEGVAV